MNNKLFAGCVSKISGQNTVVVSFSESVMHPKYHKKYAHTRKQTIHVVGEMPKVGDIINIRECKPISKTKSWIMVEDSSVRSAKEQE